MTFYVEEKTYLRLLDKISKIRDDHTSASDFQNQMILALGKAGIWPVSVEQIHREFQAAAVRNDNQGESGNVIAFRRQKRFA